MAFCSSSIPSSSSCSAVVKKKYEVFVSFRGEDTRNGFTSFLIDALSTKCITTFRDDKELEQGQPIGPGLFHAIEGSRVYIVVFSKDYASSTWCLQELAKIHYECLQISSGKHVLPIFYDVDPSEVRKQSGNYGEAFAKHEETFKHDFEKMEEVQTWIQALTDVANRSGWDIRNKSHSAEMKKIVEKVVNILGYEFSSPPHDLVGIQSPLQELEKLLRLDLIDDVRVIGICGMGGIGKTTLSNALFHKISRQFNACCFIENVSKSHKDHGPIAAQKQILHRTLNIENLQIWDHYHASNLIRSRLHLLRTIVVLDNVDQAKQPEELALNREWLGTGSRIIIISRDEHILKEFGVDGVYKVPLMDWDNSLQLFCTKAFKLRGVLTDYEKLTYNILAYADGLPLAIKVLGSFLSGRNISEWISALARLRENPNKDIMDVLRLSFDGLEDEEKEIFLDIACFFFDCQVYYVKKVLNCCGFHADIGLSVLLEKSLISIEYYWETGETKIEMHGLLQKLGRKIVQENSTEKSRKWSRLWHNKQFYNVMLENMEKNVEVIGEPQRIFSSKREEFMIEAETLSKMSHLRLLILSYGGNISGTLNCLSNELRYFEWSECPLLYLPSNFQPIQLVELILKRGSIKQLWEGKKYLPNLRNLSGCTTF